jgi:hypothetical protein
VLTEAAVVLAFVQRDRDPAVTPAGVPS